MGIGDAVRVLPVLWPHLGRRGRDNQLSEYAPVDPAVRPRRSERAANVRAVRKALAKGATRKAMAERLLNDSGYNELWAISVLREAGNLSLDEAKDAVHGALSREARSEAERTWDAVSQDLEPET